MVKLDPSCDGDSVEVTAYRQDKDKLKKQRKQSRKQQLLQSSGYAGKRKGYKHKEHQSHEHKRKEHKRKEHKEKEARRRNVKSVEERKYPQPTRSEEKYEEEDKEHKDDREKHTKQHESSHTSYRESAQSTPKIPAVVPPRTVTFPILAYDDDTLRTNRTLGTHGTLNSGTQLSLMSAQYTADTGWDSGSCGLGMFSPFSKSAGTLHDRIRNQMHIACVEGYKGKGARLTHLKLAAAKEAADVEIDASNLGRHAPTSFYGTIKTMKERFRSEAVAETCCGQEENDAFTTKLRKKIPTKEELEKYANQAKLRLLSTVEALENMRNKVGQTLGPTIERLREETENTCIQSDGWCRDRYSSLIVTSAELQLVIKSNDSTQDPPENDDTIEISKSSEGLLTQPDQVILSRLKKAASAFLERYAALVSPSHVRPENEVALKLPSNFGEDGKKLKKADVIHKFKAYEAKDRRDSSKIENKVFCEHLNNQDSEGSEEPGELEQTPGREEHPEGEKLQETEDTSGGLGTSTSELDIAGSEDEKEKNPETPEPLAALESELVTDNPLPAKQCNALPKPRRPDPTEGPIPIEPDGAKPSGSFCSVEKSLKRSCAGEKRADGTKNNLMASVSADGGDRHCFLAEKETLLEGTATCSSYSSGHPINLMESRDYSQTNRGQSIPRDSAKLNRSSASVWNKLRKLNNKKKAYALPVLGSMVNETANQQMEFPACRSDAAEDASSLVSNGTMENPIIILDESLETAERPLDKRLGCKRRALSESRRDAERLLSLEDQSHVSALTSPTQASLIGDDKGKGEIREHLQEFVQDYLGNREDHRHSPNRLEAAEHLLENLKAHMNGRRGSNGDVFLHMANTEAGASSSRNYQNEILPLTLGERPSSKIPQKHEPAAEYRDSGPEIIQVIEENEPEIVHSPTTNLVTTSSDNVPLEELTGRVVLSRYKSRLTMADPHRHAIPEGERREQIASSHFNKPPRPVISHANLARKKQLTTVSHYFKKSPPPLINPHLGPEMIDLTSVYADASLLSGYLKLQAEQRDDYDDQTEDSSFCLFRDPRYNSNSNVSSSGNQSQHQRPPATPEIFRQQPPRKHSTPTSFSSYNSYTSETKSISSSVLGILNLGSRTPSRSKSVSFNLPDDDPSEPKKTTTGRGAFRSKSKPSSKNRGGTTPGACADSISSHSTSQSTYHERAAAARRELARLSQRQAALIANRGGA